MKVYYGFEELNTVDVLNCSGLRLELEQDGEQPRNAMLLIPAETRKEDLLISIEGGLFARWKCSTITVEGSEYLAFKSPNRFYDAKLVLITR